MRVEKKYLIEEVAGHLKKSDYLILANFDRMTVADVAELRQRLAAHHAEFHVVKNSSLRVAAEAMNLPKLDDALTGPTAIVVGGRNSPGVAKVISDFIREKQKIVVKAGVLSNKLLSAKDLEKLAALPSLEVLRAQLLGLISQPASMFVRVLHAVPQGVVNVLQAKVRAAEGNK
ncbi:MAG TPA: 50S ribosomal protein L10 [Opitutaceae bacterium]|nr:50S ribosomal protein L10 [Opitutaceae bacterium]